MNRAVTQKSPYPPQALLFDVQGTATDFHSTVCGEAVRISAGRCPQIDWAQFTSRWRSNYFTALQVFKPDRDNWIAVGSVYRGLLDQLLTEYGVTELSDAERQELAQAWERLIPWPDVVPGLSRLKNRFTVAALSNADVAAVVNISKRAGLPWDAVFTAEMAGAFKPDPAVYHMAARYLGLSPSRIMMVASHKYDIRAAARLGFQTAFVARPTENGPDETVDISYSPEFDINARDFLDLASQLGC